MNSFAELSSLLPHCAEIMLTIFRCLACCKDSVAKVVARTQSPTLFPPGTNTSYKLKTQVLIPYCAMLSKNDLIKELFQKLVYDTAEQRKRNSRGESDPQKFYAVRLPLLF